MILLQKFRRFFLTIGLVLLLGSFTAFTAEESFDASFLGQPISLAQTQIAAMNRVEAIGKDIEGKAQETIEFIIKNHKLLNEILIVKSGGVYINDILDDAVEFENLDAVKWAVEAGAYTILWALDLTKGGPIREYLKSKLA